MKPRFFKTGAEFRAWLEANHDSKDEIWVGFYKKGASKKGIKLGETVEQALCFGWIDNHMRPIDNETMRLRFSPRKAKSKWSLVNVERVKKLKKARLMHPAGLKAFENRVAADYSFEKGTEIQLDAPFEKRFKAKKKAWAFFEAQPPSYRRTVLHWVMSAKQEDTRERRLDQLIASCAKGERLRQFYRPAKK